MSVGKTALLNKYGNNTFTNNYKSTIGAAVGGHVGDLTILEYFWSGGVSIFGDTVLSWSRSKSRRSREFSFCSLKQQN